MCTLYGKLFATSVAILLYTDKVCVSSYRACAECALQFMAAILVTFRSTDTFVGNKGGFRRTMEIENSADETDTLYIKKYFQEK